ncbi:MAG: group 1 truncated hemoglobin [Planctomycetes bacterium]|nr:group 1 truncated hemoglobin [Planctomycetota bacterium]
MSRWKRRCVTLFCLSVLSVFCATGAQSGQDKKSGSEKADAKTLFDSLRDVINNGAELFNNQRDYAGCYRLYQGALLSVRPFLTSDLQTKVDAALANAARMPSMADRAFELRTAIDAIRDHARGAVPAAPKDKIPEAKKDEPKKEEPKKDEVKKDALKSLWARLGGEKNVEKVVDDFLRTAGKDPKVNFDRNGKYKDVNVGFLKAQLVTFVSSVTGGPLKYIGKSMKDAHKGMGITNAEFDAAASHLKKALVDNGAKPAEVDAVLKLVGGTRQDIVEPPAKKDNGKDGGKDDKKDAPKKDEAVGEVSGKVLYKGQPVGVVYLTVTGENRRSFTTFVQKDGAFSFRTPIPAGAYKVFFENAPDKTATVAIPSRYSDVATSSLQLRVQAGRNIADFDLKE